MGWATSLAGLLGLGFDELGDILLAAIPLIVWVAVGIWLRNPLIFATRDIGAIRCGSVDAATDYALEREHGAGAEISG